MNRARWRGSGHCYYFLLRKFYWGENRETTHKSQFPFQAARRVENRHAALVKELVALDGISAAVVDAAFGIFSRLEVTHTSFIFLLFAHITFLSCVFGFGLC